MEAQKKSGVWESEDPVRVPFQAIDDFGHNFRPITLERPKVGDIEYKVERSCIRQGKLIELMEKVDLDVEDNLPSSGELKPYLNSDMSDDDDAEEVQDKLPSKIVNMMFLQISTDQ